MNRLYAFRPAFKNLIWNFGVVFLFAGAIACRDKSSSTIVTGCMDTGALNYDSKATISGPCSYTISKYGGKYGIVDTVVSFHHNMTTGWYDTTVAHYDINVTVANSNTMKFDTIVHCYYCGTSDSVTVGTDNGSFWFNDQNYPVSWGGTGHFNNDTLILDFGTSPLGGYDGTNWHKTKGVKK